MIGPRNANGRTPTEWDERAHARRDLAWGLLFLAGLGLPLAAAIVTVGRPLAIRVLLVVVVLLVCEAPLLSAGPKGRGSVGIVQPWRWRAYAFWLAVRSALLAVALLST